MSRICRPVTETLFVVCPVFMLFKDIASERKQSLLWFPEPHLILFKDIASEQKESLLLVSRVQLYLMQI